MGVNDILAFVAIFTSGISEQQRTQTLKNRQTSYLPVIVYQLPFASDCIFSQFSAKFFH